MMSYDFDLFILGAGSGGVRAARVAAGHGARVGICEMSRVGGTCVIRGCIPKKLLVYASRFAEDFADAAGYGWSVTGAVFNWPDLIAAKDREIHRLNQVYLRLLRESGVELFAQRGRFVDPHRIQLGDRVVSAERILIATGARPWRPDVGGIELAITSDDAFDLEALPERIVIVGGGYIACEFAGIFNGLGSRVTLVHRGSAVLRGFDDEVRDALGAEMARKGIGLALQRNIIALESAGADIRVQLDDGSSQLADQVLYATGRLPNVQDLGLEHTGVAVHPGGWIPVDDWSRTSVEHIYAVGDVTNRVNLTPVAIHEAQAFADTLFGGKDRPVDHEFTPSAVFSQPPVAFVGYTESSAPQHFGDIDVYRSTFRPLKHTLSGRQETMLMKLIVARATQRVVGVHVLGPDAPEIVQGFAVAVKSGLTKEQFDATLGIHPTAAEELVILRKPQGLYRDAKEA